MPSSTRVKASVARRIGRLVSIGGRMFRGQARAFRKTVAALVVILTSATGYLAVGGAPASANEGGSYDILSLRSRNVAVRSNSCQSIPISATWATGAPDGETASSDVYWSADVEVWRAAKNIGSVYMYSNANYVGNVRAKTSDYYFWCPFEGLGTLVFGPSTVDGTTYGSGFSPTWQDNFLDRTRTSTQVRQAAASNLAVTKVKRHRALRSITVRPTYYSVDASAWRAWRYKAVSVQRWNGRSWAWVKTIKTTRRGTGVARIRATRGQRFRAVAPATWNTWSATSVARIAP